MNVPRSIMTAFVLGTLLYECTASSSAQDVNQYLLAVTQQMKAKNYVQAMDSVDNALQRYPDCAALYDIRGTLKRRLSQPPSSTLQDFNQAISRAPKEANYYCHRARAYLSDGNIDLAIKDCRTAISLNPHVALAHYVLGKALLSQDDAEKALPELTKSILLRGEEPVKNGYQMRGKAYAKLGRWKDAASDYATAVKLAPEDGFLRCSYSSVLLQMNSTKEALAEVNAAIATRPTARAYRLRAECYQRLGKESAAKSDLEHASQLRAESDRTSHRQGRRNTNTGD